MLEIFPVILNNVSCLSLRKLLFQKRLPLCGQTLSIEKRTEKAKYRTELENTTEIWSSRVFIFFPLYFSCIHASGNPFSSILYIINVKKVDSNRRHFIESNWKEKWWGRPELNRRPLPETDHFLSLRVSPRSRISSSQSMVSKPIAISGALNGWHRLPVRLSSSLSSAQSKDRTWLDYGPSSTTISKFQIYTFPEQQAKH